MKNALQARILDVIVCRLRHSSFPAGYRRPQPDDHLAGLFSGLCTLEGLKLSSKVTPRSVAQNIYHSLLFFQAHSQRSVFDQSLTASMLPSFSNSAADVISEKIAWVAHAVC